MKPRSLATAGLALWLLAGALGGAALADVTDDDVQKAIDEGVAYLFSQQRANGWFSDTGYFAFQQQPTADEKCEGGLEAMAMLGLTFAPVSIRTNDQMKKGFDALIRMDMNDIYCVAPRVMVIARLLNKLDRERRELALPVLKRDIKAIETSYNSKGAWGYSSAQRAPDTYGWDFSNTQMAVLALSEADMAGIELTPETFLKVQQLFLDNQRKDGGWNYGHRGGFQNPKDINPDDPEIVPYVNGPYHNGSYGSMTAAAVASLFITRDFLYRGIGCPCKNQRSGLHPKKLDDAIDRGLDWLGKNFVADRNPFGSEGPCGFYWLYSCERVGLAAGLKYFGTHDWYREGARYILADRRGKTGWGNIVTTTYAICFLAKGRAPILFNKLKFKGEWNNHPRDIANLAKYVGLQKEQLINWQIITLQVPASEWHDAPILYITAESKIDLTPEEKQKLREFTDNGGTILFEASCGNSNVVTWWRSLVKELWPEWELKKLPKEHPVFSSDAKMARLPVIEGLEDGIRTAIFFSPVDISCQWNTQAVTARKELFDLGTNLYVYTTDRRALRARLAGVKKAPKESYARTAIAPGKQTKLKLARVKHAGDWYVGRNYDGPARLAEALKGNTPEAAELARLRAAAELSPAAPDTLPAGGLVLETVAEIEAQKLDAKDVQIAYLCGRQSIDLAEADGAAIKRYLDSGGFLLAEAVMGDKRADAAFQKAAEALGLQLKPLGEKDPLVTGGMPGATGYLLDNMKYRFALRMERIGKNSPELFGLYLGEKLVGVYSPFDLMYSQTGYDAWDCRGYEAEDARAILTNILLLVSGR